jgi:hypothetical protein
VTYKVLFEYDSHLWSYSDQAIKCIKSELVGVYIIWLLDKSGYKIPIYVGQSRNIKNRLKYHDKRELFEIYAKIYNDKLCFSICSAVLIPGSIDIASSLNGLEYLFINRMGFPPFNSKTITAYINNEFLICNTKLTDIDIKNVQFNKVSRFWQKEYRKRLFHLLHGSINADALRLSDLK